MQVAHVNANGINQIAAALGRLHKLGKDHFTADILNAWAAKAREAFDNGGGVQFEIKSWDSTTGRTEWVFLSVDGYDLEILNPA